MIRLPRWLRSGPPSFPIAIAGHGRVHHDRLPDTRRRQLLEYVDDAPPQWGLLFVVDARGRRWTPCLSVTEPAVTENVRRAPAPASAGAAVGGLRPPLEQQAIIEARCV